jgi:hypothetical protein
VWIIRSRKKLDAGVTESAASGVESSISDAMMCLGPGAWFTCKYSRSSSRVLLLLADEQVK